MKIDEHSRLLLRNTKKGLLFFTEQPPLIQWRISQNKEEQYIYLNFTDPAANCRALVNQRLHQQVALGKLSQWEHKPFDH
jgi:hypothetical protein